MTPLTADHTLHPFFPSSAVEKLVLAYYAFSIISVIFSCLLDKFRYSVLVLGTFWPASWFILTACDFLLLLLFRHFGLQMCWYTLAKLFFVFEIGLIAFFSLSSTCFLYDEEVISAADSAFLFLTLAFPHFGIGYSKVSN